MLCLVTQLCLTHCDPMDCSPPGSSVHQNSPGKDTGVGCHALLQGIFPTQKEPRSPTLQADSLLPEPPEPKILERVACPSSGDLPDPGIKLGSPTLGPLQAGVSALPAELSGRLRARSDLFSKRLTCLFSCVYDGGSLVYKGFFPASSLGRAETAVPLADEEEAATGYFLMVGGAQTPGSPVGS